jgi:hypothetical protein
MGRSTRTARRARPSTGAHPPSRLRREPWPAQARRRDFRLVQDRATDPPGEATGPCPTRALPHRRSDRPVQHWSARGACFSRPPAVDPTPCRCSPDAPLPHTSCASRERSTRHEYSLRRTTAPMVAENDRMACQGTPPSDLQGLFQRPANPRLAVEVGSGFRWSGAGCCQGGRSEALVSLRFGARFTSVLAPREHIGHPEASEVSG